MKIVVRMTDNPEMISAVYHGRKTAYKTKEVPPRKYSGTMAEADDQPNSVVIKRKFMLNN